LSYLVRVPEAGNRLYARVAQDGRRFYYWRGRVFENGTARDVRRSLGTNIERAAAEAKKLDAQAAAVERGEPIPRETTLGELVEQYVREIREAGHLGWKTPAGHLGAFREFVGGGRPMRRIGRRDVESFIQARRQTVRSATCNGALRDVKRFLAVALERGLVDANAAHRVRPVPGRPLDVRLPELHELGRILEYLKARRPWLNRLFMVLLGTGARLGEALRADWQDYDASGGRLVLRRRKVGDLLAVPLADPLRGLLWAAWAEAQMPAAGPIITGQSGEPVTANGARTEFRKAAHALGMPWLKLATARKWSATIAEEGEGLVAAQRLLGHSSSRVTEGYIRGGEQSARRRAVEAVSAVLGRVVGTPAGTRDAREAETPAPSEQKR